MTAINRYLDEEDSRWVERQNTGWTAECRDALCAVCNPILGRSEWPDRVHAELSSEDELKFAHADRAAKVLGFDTWDIHRHRLQQKPCEPGRWFHVMALCNKDRIGIVIEFAEANLELAKIATGAGNELGLGRGFEPHSCLDYILQELLSYPGEGCCPNRSRPEEPLIRNRNMAVAALAPWPRMEWPGGLERALEQAAACEPNENVRERMHRVLRSEPLSA